VFPCRRSFNSLFSCTRASFRFLRREFSSCSCLFLASRTLKLPSRSSIWAFFLSRAVWAATRFFSFLLIIFSSGLRCVSLCLFRGGLASHGADLADCSPSWASAAAAICCRISAFREGANNLNDLIWSDFGTVAMIIFVVAILL